MRLSNTASYSLNVLGYMACHEDEKMSARYLHEKLSIPYPYLRQVLRDLSHNGFIKSLRGRSGGFAFNKPIGNISIADIIDATDGLGSMNQCILGFKKCPFDNRCSMHDIWESSRNNILKILKDTSLADLVK